MLCSAISVNHSSFAASTVDQACPPRRPQRHRLTAIKGLVDRKSIAELRGVVAGVEQNVGTVGVTVGRQPRRPQARRRAGTTYTASWLEQVLGLPAQDFVHPLEQPDSLPRLPQLGVLGRRRASPLAELDASNRHPGRKSWRADAEDGGDLLQVNARPAVPCDANDIVAVLPGYSLCTAIILQTAALRITHQMSPFVQQAQIPGARQTYTRPHHLAVLQCRSRCLPPPSGKLQSCTHKNRTQ